MKKPIDMKIQSLTLIVLTLLFPLYSFAENTSEIVLKDVKITLEQEDSNSLHIDVHFSGKNYPIKTEIVENPTRLVFDIEGLILPRGRNEKLNSNLIKQARIGVHQDKTRIVFDTNLKELKNISEEKTNSGITFAVSSSTTASEQVAKIEVKNEEKLNKIIEEKEIQAPTIAPTIAPTKATKPEPSLPPTKEIEKVPSLVPNEVPSLVPNIDSKEKIDNNSDLNQISKNIAENAIANLNNEVEIVPETLDLATIDASSPVENESIKDVAKKIKSQIGANLESATEKSKLPTETVPTDNNENSVIIKSIVFQTTTEKMQSSMVVSTTAPISYTINQLSKNNYEVVIPSTKLKGEYLTLPQFPPDSFKGFVYFIAKDDATGTRIQIETDDNVKLTPYLAMGKLWIKAE